MSGILFFAIASLAILIPAWFVASRAFRHQFLSAALLYLCLVLVQMTLIELMLGISNILNLWGILVGAIISGMVLIFAAFRWVASAKLQSGEAHIQPSLEPSINSKGWVFLFLAIALFAIPLSRPLAELLQQIHWVHPLSWDVVSYHLPNVLDYIQTGSFWTIQGFFNQYPAGNEILQIWSFLPFKLDTLLGVTTAILGLGILLVSTLLLRNLLPELSAFEWGICTVFLWAICLLIPPFQDILFDFGRNDITLAFWELVALWTLQQACSKIAHSEKWWLWSGVSLGMAVGTKPIGIFYLVGFIALLLTKVIPAPDRSHPIRSKLFGILPFIFVPSVFLAGFWYIRNLIKLGTLSDKELTTAAAALSIFRSLLNPNFYQLNFPFFFFALSLGMTLFATGLWVRNLPEVSLNFKLLTGFSWIVNIALILTPSGAGYWAGDTPIFLIQIRYGIAMVPTTVLLMLGILNQAWQTFKIRHADFQHRSTTFLAELHQPPRSYSTLRLLGYFNFIGLFLLVSQIATYQPPVGLPGFDSVLFASNVKPSEIYHWVQKNLHHTVIYSVGLRPYGLYGFPFSNQVIYRLGSVDWTYQEGLKTIRDFQPQFIAISRDPFSTTVPKDLAFLFNQPKAFEVVFQDSLAAVFRITKEGKSFGK
ncbi:MAG: hypothetical protein KME16_25660 [Scytolyngbya sp. HA4215-MV1]|nr:hypothetical protein [Scytolyngbya sp. HA4215-MV1]